MDENLQLVDQGKRGEVFVAGCNLAKGYVGISEPDKFLENPYAKSLGDSKTESTLSLLSRIVQLVLYNVLIDYVEWQITQKFIELGILPAWQFFLMEHPP